MVLRSETRKLRVVEKASTRIYSEEEAATALSMSVAELRTFVCIRILQDSQIKHPSLDRFRASDLILLKVLAARPATNPFTYIV